ncbi:MAG: tetratricopeptide repeat protein, partial [Bacteroidaceae bacterium]|nr:tetratricopeptide repeat protein [Bacteroidaceae bacterium]
MRKTYLVGCLLSLLACVSCNLTTMSIVEYERLEPSSVTFPLNVTKIGVMPWGDKVSPFLRAASDEVAQNLADADYFGLVVVPTDSDLMAWNGQLSVPLSQADVDTVCRQLGVDALICVASVHTETLADYLFATKLYSCLYMNNRKPLVFCDSVQLFEGVEVDWMAELSRKCASNFVPNWAAVTRDFYTNSSIGFRDAMVMYGNGDYDSAIQIWKDIYAHSGSKKTYMAAYNLAACYERMDKPDSALVWIEKCVNASDDNASKNRLKLWSETLLKRVQNQKKLDIQLNR